ncbi:hypothetical protein OT109_15075 [Phycisphaeraceae bacterium D3-23]
MTTKRFAILEHTTDPGVHHDLLIEDPAQPDATHDDDPALWTCRIDPPPNQWAALGTLTLTPLPPHRRRYLTYQGPVAGGRGSVRRVADGAAELTHWTDTEKTITLTIAGQPLTLSLCPTPDGQLTAKVALP